MKKPADLSFETLKDKLSILNRDLNSQEITSDRFYVLEYLKRGVVENSVLLDASMLNEDKSSLLSIFSKISAIENYNLYLFKNNIVTVSERDIDSFLTINDYYIPNEELVWMPNK